MKLRYIVLFFAIALFLSCQYTGTSPGPGNSAPEITTQGTTPVDQRVGGYRNLFEERGQTIVDIDNKVNTAVTNFFHGIDSGANADCFYYEVGTDEAFILDTGNNDIRSEGMSYGMMIAVQTNRQTEFDRLWNFAKHYMQRSSGEWAGCFAWQVSPTAPYSIMGTVSAPDGEEYMAMALYFAWKRWDSVANSPYKLAADAILDHMLHQDTYAGAGSIVTNFIDPVKKQVVFVPYGNSALFTDPSYHVPAFYELWRLWYGTGNPTDEHNAYWGEVAVASRTLLWRACHAATGLAPDYSSFDGVAGPANNAGHDQFRSDAWRVIQNLAVDCAWFGGTTSEMTVISRLYDFFYSRGMSTYIGYYTIDGTAPVAGWHSTGLVAMNAVGALVTTNTHASQFIDALWSATQPTGTYRYYDGCLYMLGLLHCSGKYQMYGYFPV
jgi:oligosaccharide reducing-end xylanase